MLLPRKDIILEQLYSTENEAKYTSKDLQEVSIRFCMTALAKVILN